LCTGSVIFLAVGHDDDHMSVAQLFAHINRRSLIDIFNAGGFLIKSNNSQILSDIGDGLRPPDEGVAVACGLLGGTLSILTVFYCLLE
jgi:hypothetical protein